MYRTKKYTRCEKVQDEQIYMTGKCTGQENIQDGIEYRMGYVQDGKIYRTGKYTEWEKVQDGNRT